MMKLNMMKLNMMKLNITKLNIMKRNMKRNIMIAVCCSLILCALTGCRLAKEGAGPNAYEDRLVGVFIATEYIDLFDFEGYLNDNINSFNSGEFNIDGRNMQKYQNRIYAALIPRTDIEEETGKTIRTYEYVFEDIEGIQFCIPEVQDADEENSYIALMTDPAISDRHTDLFYSDNEKNISLEGTLYITASNMSRTYYFHPVYQCPDGSVYLASGDGFNFSSEGYSESDVYTHTIEASTTVSENGKEKKESISIKVSISTMFAPEEIIFLQMDTDNSLISRTEYKPDMIPDVIALEKSAEYFIVETHKKDDTGSPIVLRDIFSKDVEYIETFFAREDGVCVKQVTEIIGQ